MEVSWRDALVPVRVIFGEYLSKAKGTLFFVTIVIILSSITGVVAPYIFSRLIDQLTTDAFAVTLIYGFAVYAVLIGFADLLDRTTNHMSFLTAERLYLFTVGHFFRKICRKHIGFFIDHNAAEITSTKNKGSTSLFTVLHLSLNFLLPGVVRIIASLAVLGAAISLDIMLVVLFYGLGFVVFTYFVNRWTVKFLDAAVEARQENSRFTGNAINAIETLRYFGTEKWILGRYLDSNRRSYEGWRSYSLRRIAYGIVYGVAAAAQIGITFAILLPRFRSGDMTVGDIVLFFMLLAALNWPFQMIAMMIDRIVKAYSDFKPFAEMWNAPEESDVGEQPPMVLQDGSIVFENVSYSYDGGRGIDGVSFEVHRGKINFIIGETGSGKSTIFKLALKALDPAEGKILIDGIDITEVERSRWYQNIGVVPQDIVLMNDSIATNIALGREIDEDRLQVAAKKASILDRINDMPEKFDTVVGEKGLKLSVGERQRIALARALYSDPKVLFLDEASSALDETTEAQIMKHIRDICDDVTVLAITHRMSSVRPDDHVIQLKKGNDMLSEVRVSA